MQTEKIILDVSPQTALAWHKASPAERERLQQRTDEMLRFALMTPEEAAEEFKRLSAETSAHAENQGLTPEILDALLQDDDEA